MFAKIKRDSISRHCVVDNSPPQVTASTRILAKSGTFTTRRLPL